MSQENDRQWCAVSVAFGGWYPAGQARLCAALRAQGMPVDAYDHTAGFDPCGKHCEHPYSFKPAALLNAMATRWLRSDRFERFPERMLWLDASCVPTRPVEPEMRRWRDELGPVVTMHTGFEIGQWLGPEAAAGIGVTDEERRWPLVAGGVVGFDTSDTRAWDALAEWSRSTRWFASADRNHRHDQTVLSIILGRMGLRTLPNDSGLFTYGKGSGGLFELYPATPDTSEHT